MANLTQFSASKKYSFLHSDVAGNVLLEETAVEDSINGSYKGCIYNTMQHRKKSIKYELKTSMRGLNLASSLVGKLSSN